MDTITEATEPRLDIGGNNPPGKTELERVAVLTATVNDWIAGRPEITDTDMANEAQAFVDKLRVSKKDLAAAQKVDLAPHEQQIVEVKGKYRGPLDTVETVMKALLEKTSAWLVKERTRIAAEKAAQEAEARRLREEAERLERERVEAVRRAEEERQRLIAAETEIAGDAERAEIERREVAEAAARAVEAARTAKAAERAAEKKPEVAAIKSDPARRAMTLRVYWSAIVVDEIAAIESYKDHPVVRKAALAAALQVANEAARTAKDEAAAPLGFRFLKDERAS